MLNVVCKRCEKLQEFKSDDIKKISSIVDKHSLGKNEFLDMLGILGGECEKNGYHEFVLNKESEEFLDKIISLFKNANLNIERINKYIKEQDDKIDILKKELNKEEANIQDKKTKRDTLLQEIEKYKKDFRNLTGCDNIWNIEDTGMPVELIPEEECCTDIELRNRDSFISNEPRKWPFKIKLSTNELAIERCPIDFTFEIPSSVTIEEKNYFVDNSQDLEMKVIYEFLNRHKDTFYKVLELSGARGRKIFSKDPKDIVRPVLIDSTDMYVETNLSGHYIAEVCYAIADKFGYYKTGRFRINKKEKLVEKDNSQTYRLLFKPTGLSLSKDFSYTDCITKLVENLVSIHDDFDSKIKDSRISKYFSCEFYSGGSGGGRSRLIKDNIYLKTNFSAKDTIKVAYEIIDVFGHQREDLLFT